MFFANENNAHSEERLGFLVSLLVRFGKKIFVNI